MTNRVLVELLGVFFAAGTVTFFATIALLKAVEWLRLKGFLKE
jgi:hypothetical protein